MLCPVQMAGQNSQNVTMNFNEADLYCRHKHYLKKILLFDLLCQCSLQLLVLTFSFFVFIGQNMKQGFSTQSLRTSHNNQSSIGTVFVEFLRNCS